MVVRDDLLHPVAGGNKMRKLDAVWPRLMARGHDRVVTLGGMQSAHCAAVACLGAEHGVHVDVLLRGEPPRHPPTGNLLVTAMYARHIEWIDRDRYADRDAVLRAWGDAHNVPEEARIPEVAASRGALLGQIRLIAQLADALPTPDAQHTLVIDAGTGTSAIGLALGIYLLDLPWRVEAVTLIPNHRDGYVEAAATLCAMWCGDTSGRPDISATDLALDWVPRTPARRFGAVRPEDISRCTEIARATGILTDPMYTLAAVTHIEAHHRLRDDGLIWVHTGGMLNLFGASQRLGAERMWGALAGEVIARQ